MLNIRNDGDFTSHIASLPPGEVADVLPPFGRYQRFIDEHEPDAPLMMLAGGIGVTPLLSLLTAYAGSGRRITFLYGARTPGQLVYADALEQMGRSYPNVDVQLRAGGRFTGENVANTLGQGTLYLIAGPYAMQHSWRSLLLRRSVNADDIYYEPFSM